MIAALCACVKVPEYCSNNNEFDPATEFCYGGKSYKKCNGGEYNPEAEFCSGLTVYKLCGDNEYNPSTEFCFLGKPYKSCNGNEYNPETEFCSGSAIYRLCGGSEYSPSTEFCDGSEVKLKPPELYTYTVAYNGNGNTDGSAPTDPSSPYLSGLTVIVLGPGTLTKAGSAFSAWNTRADGGGASYKEDTSFAITANTVLFAQWAPAYTISITANPAAGGTVSRSPDKTNYASGETVRVTATPGTGYVFKNWTGASTTSENPLTITMDGNKTLVAVFDKPSQGGTSYTLTTGVEPANSGSVSLNPDNTSYASGTQVTATAQPASGYAFKNWKGASTATANPVTVTMNGTKTLTAVFEKLAAPCTLTTGVTPTGGGSVTRSPENEVYAPGTQVTVTAIPGKCHEFNSWTGASLSPNNPLKITLDGSKTLIAKFDKVCDGGTPGEPLEYEGQTYRTVVIGGKTWMAENLNYDTANNRGSWCYDYNPDYCAKYGRRYDWNTAMSVCPDGWHLPTEDEWDELVIAADGVDGRSAGRRLKATTGWGVDYNGTDDFGFSALPGGDACQTSVGYGGSWWTATEDGEISRGREAYLKNMGYNYTYVASGLWSKSCARSVRCVGDD
jgi:uncharacterized protein (TIGR02145 family)/uncharacterized repeat protein (TIGR02543 family)